jgi:hypothetical protein
MDRIRELLGRHEFIRTNRRGGSNMQRIHGRQSDPGSFIVGILD